MKRFIFLLLVPIPVTVLAQTETTEWWVNGEVYATTSCETGGDISTPPQNPTKKGHTFQGWETATFDLATLDTSINGSDYTYNNSARKWRTAFSYGYVYGESLCSPTPNAGSGWYPTSQELDAETGTGRYCYCRATEFLPTGSSKIYEAVASRWVFGHDYVSASNCAGTCADFCGDRAKNNSSLRVGLFGSLSQ